MLINGHQLLCKLNIVFIKSKKQKGHTLVIKLEIDKDHKVIIYKEKNFEFSFGRLRTLNNFLENSTK